MFLTARLNRSRTDWAVPNQISFFRLPSAWLLLSWYFLNSLFYFLFCFSQPDAKVLSIFKKTLKDMSLFFLSIIKFPLHSLYFVWHFFKCTLYYFFFMGFLLSDCVPHPDDPILCFVNHFCSVTFSSSIPSLVYFFMILYASSWTMLDFSPTAFQSSTKGFSSWTMIKNVLMSSRISESVKIEKPSNVCLTYERLESFCEFQKSCKIVEKNWPNQHHVKSCILLNCEDNRDII